MDREAAQPVFFSLLFPQLSLPLEWFLSDAPPEDAGAQAEGAVFL